VVPLVAYQANLPVEGIPVNCSARLERMTNGEFVIKVRFKDKTAIDELERLKVLKDNGVLTEEEFSEARESLNKSPPIFARI
jgi:hypothetical protein